MSTVDARQFEAYRPLMFSIAYRMLGSVTEAEDIVQEAYLRYQATPTDQIVSHKAFLSTIVTRLCLNQLQSARVQRESYIGPWLPEPVLTGVDERFAPMQQAELHESLALAFLVLLEQLTPVERAVFLLREIFDYDYAEIAEIIGKSEDNARQLATRARRHVDDGKPRFEASKEKREELAGRFFAAVQDGDMQGLEALLSEDVVLKGDGGGKAPALARSLHGRNRVARTVGAWMRTGLRVPGLTIRPVEVNGQPGALFRDADGAVIAAMELDIADGQVQGINSIVNPDKLRHLGEVADAWALLRGMKR
jgi:RNA polymerase sigma-70 factor, ECF subfamily